MEETQTEHRGARPQEVVPAAGLWLIFGAGAVLLLVAGAGAVLGLGEFWGQIP